MAVELIAKIKPKNNGDFKLVDADDVETKEGKSLEEKLDELEAMIEKDEETDIDFVAEFENALTVTTANNA